jgi:hypothetical protein
MDNRRRAFIVASLGICAAVLLYQSNVLSLIEYSETETRRRRNKRRRRDHFEEKLESWNDREFKSQTSLSRMVFNYVATMHYRSQSKENQRMAELSSGSVISTRMRLFVFLRLAKGANYALLWRRDPLSS